MASITKILLDNKFSDEKELVAKLKDDEQVNAWANQFDLDGTDVRENLYDVFTDNRPGFLRSEETGITFEIYDQALKKFFNDLQKPSARNVQNGHTFDDNLKIYSDALGSLAFNFSESINRLLAAEGNNEWQIQIPNMGIKKLYLNEFYEKMLTPFFQTIGIALSNVKALEYIEKKLDKYLDIPVRVSMETISTPLVFSEAPEMSNFIECSDRAVLHCSNAVKLPLNSSDREKQAQCFKVNAETALATFKKIVENSQKFKDNRNYEKTYLRDFNRNAERVLVEVKRMVDTGDCASNMNENRIDILKKKSDFLKNLDQDLQKEGQTWLIKVAEITICEKNKYNKISSTQQLQMVTNPYSNLTFGTEEGLNKSSKNFSLKSLTSQAKALNLGDTIENKRIPLDKYIRDGPYNPRSFHDWKQGRSEKSFQEFYNLYLKKYNTGLNVTEYQWKIEGILYTLESASDRKAFQMLFRGTDKQPPLHSIEKIKTEVEFRIALTSLIRQINPKELRNMKKQYYQGFMNPTGQTDEESVLDVWERCNTALINYAGSEEDVTSEQRCNAVEAFVEVIDDRDWIRYLSQEGKKFVIDECEDWIELRWFIKKYEEFKDRWGTSQDNRKMRRINNSYKSNDKQYLRQIRDEKSDDERSERKNSKLFKKCLETLEELESLKKSTWAKKKPETLNKLASKMEEYFQKKKNYQPSSEERISIARKTLETYKKSFDKGENKIKRINDDYEGRRGRHRSGDRSRHQSKTSQYSSAYSTKSRNPSIDSWQSRSRSRNNSKRHIDNLNERVDTLLRRIQDMEKNVKSSKDDEKRVRSRSRNPSEKSLSSVKSKRNTNLKRIKNKNEDDFEIKSYIDVFRSSDSESEESWSSSNQDSDVSDNYEVQRSRLRRIKGIYEADEKLKMERSSDEKDYSNGSNESSEISYEYCEIGNNH